MNKPNRAKKPDGVNDQRKSTKKITQSHKGIDDHTHKNPIKNIEPEAVIYMKMTGKVKKMRLKQHYETNFQRCRH